MILCLLPGSDYDPTESSVPWQALRRAGHQVCFATPDGSPAYADARLVEKGFGPLNPFLMTRRGDLQAYREMRDSQEFAHPLSYAEVQPERFSALLVPGGHAAGMRSLLESDRARELVLAFFRADKPVAAVCHGLLLLARTLDPQSGRSVLHGRKVTALPARTMELPAWLVTAPWLGRYYRTYQQTVEGEVKAALASPADFSGGPWLPLRDAPGRLRWGFTVRDGNLLSARWPGDCHRFAAELVAMLEVSESCRYPCPTPHR